jgi:hypothetical protein
MREFAWKSVIMALLVLWLVAFAWSQKEPGTSHPDTTGWQGLFAPDLSDAIFNPGGWVFEDGVLVAKSGETIWTKESYGNFILDFEFKVAKAANSGVFLRTGDIKNILSALEIQIHESTDGAKPPSKDVTRPAGEWNRYTITCQDSRLAMVFNGEQVLNLDLNDWKEPNKNPDGTRNKFSVALRDYARKGPIGLQGLHGREAAPVWFRSLKIKVLQ